jgi:hypothetical protein
MQAAEAYAFRRFRFRPALNELIATPPVSSLPSPFSPGFFPHSSMRLPTPSSSKKLHTRVTVTSVYLAIGNATWLKNDPILAFKGNG